MDEKIATVPAQKAAPVAVVSTKQPAAPSKSGIYLVKLSLASFDLFIGQAKRSRDQKLSRMAVGQDDLEEVRFRPVGYVGTDIILEVGASLGQLNVDRIEEYIEKRTPALRVWSERHDTEDFPPIPGISISGHLGILFIPSGLEQIYNAWTVTSYRWLYSKAYDADIAGTYALVTF